MNFRPAVCSLSPLSRSKALVMAPRRGYEPKFPHRRPPIAGPTLHCFNTSSNSLVVLIGGLRAVMRVGGAAHESSARRPTVRPLVARLPMIANFLLLRLFARVPVSRAIPRAGCVPRNGQARHRTALVHANPHL